MRKENHFEKYLKNKFICIGLTALMALGLTSCGGAKVDYSPGNGENTDDSVGTETAAGQQAETSGLARELSVPESCEVTFDTGESGLGGIRSFVDNARR